MSHTIFSNFHTPNCSLVSYVLSRSSSFLFWPQHYTANGLLGIHYTTTWDAFVFFGSRGPCDFTIPSWACCSLFCRRILLKYATWAWVFESFS